MNDELLERGTPTRDLRESVVDPQAAKKAQEEHSALVESLRQTTIFMRRMYAQSGKGRISRSQAIREEIAKGNTKPREIVKALADPGIIVSKVLIARVKAREKK